MFTIMSVIATALAASAAAGSLTTAIAILGGAGASLRNTKKSIKAQKEREKRLEELQERYRFEDKQFQKARDLEQERFQFELEAQRMSFQEHLEMRRLQFQVKMEQHREDFQRELTKVQQNFSRELAQFQAQAMRETQILVARENAQLLMENQMVMEALKTFPLNISPMVLLNNRPHSLSSLMRYTVGDIEIDGANNQKMLLKANPEDVIEDVINYVEHPEALNIFIAPVFVDSKVPFQKMISTRIWEITYQKIESFFTKNYSRDGKTPVVFYPTAWNDKYTSGVHASETLHYFLKDLPCIVLEPKFDGNRFRMAISHWGLGFGSTEHYRTECDFNINTDQFIADAVYERSKKGLEAYAIMDAADVLLDTEKKQKYFPMEHAFRKNIKLYEAFKLDQMAELSQEEQEKIASQISAMGLGNVFTIDNTQDLEPLAQYLSSQIGVILAMLSDTHHLLSTGATPVLPQLMQKDGFFEEVYAEKQICEQLFKNYKSVMAQLRDEERLLAETDKRVLVDFNWNLEIRDVRERFGIKEAIPEQNWKELVAYYTKMRFGFKDEDFEKIWGKFVQNIEISDMRFAEFIFGRIDDDNKKSQLEYSLESL